MSPGVVDKLNPAQRREFERLARTYPGFQVLYQHNPRGFVRTIFEWPVGESPKPYQDHILGMVPIGRTCVRSLHGVGKTTIAAWIALWFSLTRDGWSDWKIVTTASVWRQLERYLWPEIHKWARLIRWERVGRPPFTRDELQSLAIKLSTGEAFAVASDNPGLIEGAHAKRMLYIFDESKLIQSATFDASEGAFTQAGLPGHEALAFAISTPGPPMGRFYEIQTRKKGFGDWQVRRITLDEAIACGQVSRDWADARKLMWGEDSSMYRNRVLGEFAADSERGVIPLAWIEAANQRWLDWKDRAEATPGYLANAVYVGCDVADEGKDKNVQAIRVEDEHVTVISEIRRHEFNQDPMQTAGQIRGIVQATNAIPVVDGIGVGSGVVSRLRELQHVVLSFIASAGSDARDRSGELGFVNLRAAGWWTLRERLDPSSPLKPVALPPDDLLTGDLTTPRYRTVSGAAIQIESKEDIAKRLDGRSTDTGDAVVMAMGAELVDDRRGASWQMY